MLRLNSRKRVGGRRRHQRRHGEALIEFALTVPLLFLFLFGAVEFARAHMLVHTADNAAYEGARRGIVPGAKSQDVRDTVDLVLASVGASGYEVHVTPSDIAVGTTAVTVQIDMPMNSNGFVAPLFFRDKALVSSMTMQREDLGQTVVP